MPEGAVVRVLGPLELRGGGSVVALASARRRVMLLRLIIGGGWASSDALLDALWGESPPPSARSTLKSHATHLRTALREVGLDLVGRRGGYEVPLRRSDVDVFRFEDLLAEARASADVPHRIEQLGRALELWRGRAFDEVADEAFAAPEAARLEELRLQAIEVRAEAHLRLGRHGEVVAELEALLVAHPLREQLWGLLVVALYRSGRQGEALRRCDELRARLRDELGVSPGPRIQAFERAVLEQRDEALDPPLERPDGAPAGVASYLPAPLGPLIGRAAQLEEVAGLLRQQRLVVLTGPGGVGKTRLAIAVGGRMVQATGTPAAFANLGSLSQGASVPGAIAIAVAGHQADWSEDLLAELAAWLGHRRLLLVVDNCEHLLDDAANAVERLLHRCSGLRVLATSRCGLGVTGGVTWPVPPLRTRLDPQSPAGVPPAVELFLERARAVNPVTELGEQDRQVVEGICVALDGLPLAIELAAARSDYLAPAQIAERLDQPRPLPGDGRRPGRQVTLDATIRWSVDLLNEPERTLFHRLSVFAGEFPLEAVEGICADDDAEREAVLDHLAALVRASLVVTVHSATAVRYRLLDTMRRYGSAALAHAGDLETRRLRHARWFTRVCLDAEPHLAGPDEASWLDRLHQQHADTRRALRTLLEGGLLEETLAATTALRRYWRARGLTAEGRDWLREALAASGLSPACRAKGLRVGGWLAREQGDYIEARSLFEEALAIYRRLADRGGTGWALVDLGFLDRYEARYQSARERLEESVTLLEQSGELEGLAAAYGNLGLLARDEGALAAAEDHLGTSLALFRRCGDLVGSGWTLTALGMIARAQDRTGQARSRLDEALALWEQLDDRPNMANVMSTSAAVARDEGDLSGGAALLQRALVLYRELGDRRGTAFALEGFAVLAAARCEEQLAGTLLAGAAALRREIAAPPPPAWWQEICSTMEAAGCGAAVPSLTGADAGGPTVPVELAVGMAFSLAAEAELTG